MNVPVTWSTCESRLRWHLLFINKDCHTLYAYAIHAYGWIGSYKAGVDTYLWRPWHYSDVIMSTMAYQITSVSTVYSTVCSGADQRKHQSSASLACVRGIHRWPVISPHNGPVTRKMFSFDDVVLFDGAMANKIWNSRQSGYDIACLIVHMYAQFNLYPEQLFNHLYVITKSA